MSYRGISEQLLDKFSVEFGSLIVLHAHNGQYEGIVIPRTKLVSNMFSEDIEFEHIANLGKEIQEEISKETYGVVITHGTYTMHISLASLSLIAQNLSEILEEKIERLSAEYNIPLFDLRKIEKHIDAFI